MATRNPSQLSSAALAGGRVVALDYGSTRTGIAISDSARKVAMPRGQFPSIWKELKPKLQALQQEGVTLAVLGLPLNMDGTTGPTATKVASLADLIEKELGLPVLLCDERLTSHQAESAFFEQRDGGRTGRRQTRASKRESVGHIDATAATLLLQTALDILRN